MPKRSHSCSQRIFMICVLFTFIMITVFTIISAKANHTLTKAESEWRNPENMEKHISWTRDGPPPSSRNDDFIISGPPPPRPASFDAFIEMDKYLPTRLKEAGLIRLFPYEENKPPAWRDGLELDQAREICASFEDVIAKIHALAAMSGPFAPLDFSKGRFLDMPHYHLAPKMGRLLLVDAICHSKNGENDAALEDLLDIMRLGDALAMDPLLYLQSKSIYLYNMAHMGLITAFPPGTLTPDQSNRVISHIQGQLHRHAFAEGIRGDVILEKRVFKQLKAGKMPDEVKGVTFWDNLPIWVCSTLPARPWLCIDEASYTQIKVSLANEAEKPFYEALKGIADLQEKAKSYSNFRIFTKMFTISMVDTLQWQARHEATLGLIETGLLVEQEIALTGAVPESIAFAGAAAVDPFTGAPFIYHAEGDTFILYSTGPNLKDDGGVNMPGIKWVEGDIIWRSRESMDTAREYPVENRGGFHQ